MDIQNTDYTLTINQVKVSNIEVNTSDSDINFEVVFTLDDNLKLDNIKKYSIDIVR